MQGLPGWDSGSYGYHGDDGFKFESKNRGQGEVYSYRFGSGDIVGCIFDQKKKTLSFTRNGQFLGLAFENVQGEFYPAVGTMSRASKISVNYGQQKFVFDVNHLKN